MILMPLPPRSGARIEGPAVVPAPAPPETLEEVVSRLAPLYKERSAIQVEIAKLQDRLESINRQVDELQQRLRELSTRH